MTADADHGKRKPFSLASGSRAMNAVDGIRERYLYCPFRCFSPGSTAP
jgi:hypothetical protein